LDDEGTMLDLNDFFYFVQVVDRGGFTAAGRTLHMPKSTLSHRILELETRLGVRLLNRTSRRFAMTDAGAEFYRHAVAMLREAEQAETAIPPSADRAGGHGALYGGGGHYAVRDAHHRCGLSASLSQAQCRRPCDRRERRHRRREL
jgi:DNA-binding transcriptional LysR family regulator